MSLNRRLHLYAIRHSRPKLQPHSRRGHRPRSRRPRSLLALKGQPSGSCVVGVYEESWGCPFRARGHRGRGLGGDAPAYYGTGRWPQIPNPKSKDGNTYSTENSEEPSSLPVKFAVKFFKTSPARFSTPRSNPRIWGSPAGPHPLPSATASGTGNP